MMSITNGNLSTIESGVSGEAQPQTDGITEDKSKPNFYQGSFPYNGGHAAPSGEIPVDIREEITLEEKAEPVKIYISGPITGVDGFMEHFAEVDNELTACGYYVINPAKVNSGMPLNTSWEDYMRLSFCMLDMCDAIYMLSNWEASRGAVMEYYRAVRAGKRVAFHTPQVRLDILQKTTEAVADIRL